jgi:D-sedoheptulose 7-phosphate isomerase
VSNLPVLSAVFGDAVDEHIQVLNKVRAECRLLEQIAAAMTQTVRSGGKILWCGNGGSAADSQHLAAELVGRFRQERVAIPSIALNTNTSVLSAIGNDYGYEYVFSRQVEALGNRGDLLVGISTSGNSLNVIKAIEAARSKDVITVALTGAGGGKMGQIADHLFAVPSRDTARIQEMHIMIGHILCDWVELDWVQNARREIGIGVQVRSLNDSGEPSERRA